MVARVLTQEFVAKERQSVVLESIDGLRHVRTRRGLTPLQRAALEALERLYSRTVRGQGIITSEAMSRPVAVAQKAIEALTATNRKD